MDECKTLLYEEVFTNGPTMSLQGYSTTKPAMSGQLDYNTAPHNPVEMRVPTNKNPDTLATRQADMILFPTFPQSEPAKAAVSGISEQTTFSTLCLIVMLLTGFSMATFTSNPKVDTGTCTALGFASSCCSLALSDAVDYDVWEGEEVFLDLWGAGPYDDTGEMFDKLEEVSEIDKLRNDLKPKNENFRSMVKTSEDQEQQSAEESKSLEEEISQLKSNKRFTPTEDSSALEILKQRISELETMVRNLAESVANNEVKMNKEKLEETKRSKNSDDQEMKNQVGPATKDDGSTYPQTENW